MHKNFADWYQIISLRPDGQTLDARWKAVVAVADNLKTAQVPGLVRVFYSRPGSEGMKEIIRNAAKTEDATFLMQGNDAELPVLAGAVIAHTVGEAPTDVADAAAIAVTCMEARGMRQSLRLQGAVDETARYLANEAVRVRMTKEDPVTDINGTDFAKQIATKGGVAVNDINTLWNAVEAVLKDLLARHANHTQSINRAFNEVLNRQREESDIAWWLFSEHTLDGAKAFSELTVPEACFRGAKDLAELTRVLPGPVAAPAFLHKMLGLVKKKPPASVGIAEAVDSCNLEWRRNWISSLSVQDLPDLCPMLFALSKSVEVGGGEGWTAAFEHATGLSIDGKLAPVRVALQIYQEALLVRALAKE